jgi:hypothetical protein
VKRRESGFGGAIPGVEAGISPPPKPTGFGGATRGVEARMSPPQKPTGFGGATRGGSFEGGMRDSRAGIALLELVTALLIVTIGLFGVIQMYQVGIGRIQEAQRMALAVRLIDNEIETLRSMPFGALQDGEDMPWVTGADIIGLHDAAGGVDVAAFAGDDRLKQVSVRLAWREGARTVRREVVTVIGEGIG